MNQLRHELADLGGGAHALAIQIMGNADDAADAVQDALTTVLERPGAYEPDKGPLRPWFLRVVRNRCIDLLRRRKPGGTPVEELPDPSVGPEKAAEIAEVTRLLQAALTNVAPQQRQIVVLRDYLDLPYAQIATVLDVPPGTVMSRLHRARLALARAYREIDERSQKQ
ncbi:MAG: RNA polymerase sigma factor [Woeseiaceae bacterium]